jgi:hypothetical protein
LVGGLKSVRYLVSFEPARVLAYPIATASGTLASVDRNRRSSTSSSVSQAKPDYLVLTIAGCPWCLFVTTGDDKVIGVTFATFRLFQRFKFSKSSTEFLQRFISWTI